MAVRMIAAFICIAVLFFSAQAPAQDQPPDQAQPTPVSQEALDDLIQLLEDDQERQVFLERLKTLSRLQAEEKTVEEAEAAALIDRLFDRLNRFTDNVAAASLKLYALFMDLPEIASDLGNRLVQPRQRDIFWRFLGGLLASLILALIARLAVRPFRIKPPAARPGVMKRLWLGFLVIFHRILPWAVLMAAYTVAFQALPVWETLRDMVFFILTTLFFYHLAMGVVDALVAPGNPKRRLVGLDDEDSHYVRVWAGRVGQYAVIYVLAVELPAFLGADPSVIQLIRGLLLLGFALMLSALVLQLRRELKTRFLPSAEAPAIDGETPGKTRLRQLKRAALKYWWLPAMLYIWVLTVLLIGRLSNALGYLGEATAASLMVLAGLFAALSLNRRGFDRLFEISGHVKDLFPGLEEKAAGYLRLVRVVMKGVLIFIGLSMLAQVWGVPVVDLLTSHLGVSFLKRLLTIAVTVGAVMLLIEAAGVVSDRLMNAKDGTPTSQKRQTFLPLFKTAFVVAVFFIGGVVVLGQLGVDVGPILAGAGIISLGVGLGAQSLVKDVINGAFILVGDLISVGDVAQVGGKGGLVESVGLRTIRLRDLAGNVHTVPNSAIDTVTNMTKGYSRYVLDVGVAYREDVDEVMDILRRVGEEMQHDPEYGPLILEPLEILGVDQLADSAVVVRARTTTKPIQQWAVGREFNRRIKKAFDAAGVEIPFPHRTVYLGEPKEGRPPSLYVRMGRVDDETAEPYQVK